MKEFLGGRVRLHAGDCREVIAGLPDASVDSVVTDPPYHLTSIVKRFGADDAAPAKSNGATGVYGRASSGFMGKKWDGGSIAFDSALWAEVLRVLKPGGHMVAFGGTRTYHRMVCAIEDAGFEIRDQIGWAFGSGFPKSHDVSKGLDKSAGHWRGRAGAVTIEEQTSKGTEYERTDKGDPITDGAITWQGWGTALKPAWEPICLARKPLIGTVAENVLAWGTGAINVDACRVGVDADDANHRVPSQGNSGANSMFGVGGHKGNLQSSGRWPANLVHDGSEEVLAAFPDSESTRSTVTSKPGSVYGMGAGLPSHPGEYGFNDSGSAARFFYSAKADSDDRIGSKHPTVKPVDLMRWLSRLVTPPGGTILDPFAGTGTTGEAAFYEDFSAILIEREAEYIADIERRMRLVMAGPDERARESIKARMAGKPRDDGPLFAREVASGEAEYTAALAACREAGIMDPWAGKSDVPTP